MPKDFQPTSGGVLPVGTLPGEFQQAVDPGDEAPVLDIHDPAPAPADPYPLDPAQPDVPQLGAGQQTTPGIELLLLAPDVWQGVDREKAQAGVTAVTQVLDGMTTGEALTTLAAAASGVLDADLPQQAWNQAVYDFVLILQNQLIGVAIDRQQRHTTGQTTEGS